jgi:hypothetical protein
VSETWSAILAAMAACHPPQTGLALIIMDFEGLKQQLAGLSNDERRRVIAYLVSLQNSEDKEYRQEIARRMADNSPGHWLTLEELDARLGLSN